MTEASILRSEFEEFKTSILKRIDELEARLPKAEETVKVKAEETVKVKAEEVVKPKTTKKSQKDIVVEAKDGDIVAS